MKIEPLRVRDAWVCQPEVHDDSRGSFAEWFRADRLEAVTGHRLMVAQANHSVSAAGVIRGLHFADVPPGQAKYVYCTSGAALDVVVDIRVGSPTYGAIDLVRLDDVDRRGVYLAAGLAHGFCALRDDTSVTYLVSTVYNPGAEHGISPHDTDLGIEWPTEVGNLVTSDKDAGAPTLADARAAGLLPDYETCLAVYRAR
jgi:dTDP-4-dehydrorhamnose 3,5-epimerase